MLNLFCLLMTPSLIVSNHNYVEYKEDINTAFIQLNEWFNANLLILNYKIPYHIQFRAQINRLNEIGLKLTVSMK